MPDANTILREFPPNPHLVNYHTRRQLTAMMSERYTPNSERYPEQWIAALADISGLTNIHLMRHKLRLKRNPDIPWENLTPKVEKILPEYWDSVKIQPVSNDVDARRDFDLPESLYFEKREVYEGVHHSKKSELAARLYEIQGITTLVFYRDTVTVKRGYCYPWEEIEPKLQQILWNFEG